MSHGVNRGVLKKGTKIIELNFLDKLIKKIPNIKYDFYGFQINNQYGEMILTML